MHGQCGLGSSCRYRDPLQFVECVPLEKEIVASGFKFMYLGGGHFLWNPPVGYYLSEAIISLEIMGGQGVFGFTE